MIERIQVRKKGLEPPRLAAPDPKSGAATNYATSAAKFWTAKITNLNQLNKRFLNFIFEYGFRGKFGKDA